MVKLSSRMCTGTVLKTLLGDWLVLKTASRLRPTSSMKLRSTERKRTSTVTMIAPADFQLKQMLEILKLRIAKRGIDIACLEVKDPEVNLARAKQLVILKHGIDADAGRKVSRLIKDSKLKVQAQIQGDKVRVIGKKRDDLQEAIAFLRKSEVGVPLQFNNFRD